MPNLTFVDLLVLVTVPASLNKRFPKRTWLQSNDERARALAWTASGICRREHTPTPRACARMHARRLDGPRFPASSVDLPSPLARSKIFPRQLFRLFSVSKFRSYTWDFIDPLQNIIPFANTFSSSRFGFCKLIASRIIGFSSHVSAGVLTIIKLLQCVRSHAT